MSGLKQIIEKQNAEYKTLENIVERLQDENKMLVKENAKNSIFQSKYVKLKKENKTIANTNIKLMSKIEMIKKMLVVKKVK